MYIGLPEVAGARVGVGGGGLTFACLTVVAAKSLTTRAHGGGGRVFIVFTHNLSYLPIADGQPLLPFPSEVAQQRFLFPVLSISTSTVTKGRCTVGGPGGLITHSRAVRTERAGGGTT